MSKKLEKHLDKARKRSLKEALSIEVSTLRGLSEDQSSSFQQKAKEITEANFPSKIVHGELEHSGVEVNENTKQKTKGEREVQYVLRARLPLKEGGEILDSFCDKKQVAIEGHSVCNEIKIEDKGVNKTKNQLIEKARDWKNEVQDEISDINHAIESKREETIKRVTETLRDRSQELLKAEDRSEQIEEKVSEELGESTSMRFRRTLGFTACIIAIVALNLISIAGSVEIANSEVFYITDLSQLTGASGALYGGLFVIFSLSGGVVAGYRDNFADLLVIEIFSAVLVNCIATFAAWWQLSGAISTGYSYLFLAYLGPGVNICVVLGSIVYGIFHLFSSW